MSTSVCIFIIYLFKLNCYVIDIKPVARITNSSILSAVDDLKILGKKKVPSILVYIGSPPQSVIVGLTLQNNKSWVMVKKGEKYIFDETKSNSFDKDIKFYTFVYEDRYYIGELCYDYFKVEKNSHIKENKKFQFLKYDLFEEHIFNSNEIKGEIGLNIKTSDDNDIDLLHQPNQRYSISNNLFIDYLKSTNQIKNSKIAITFTDEKGTLYIDENLNLSKFCNINKENILSCELEKINFGTNITYSQSDSIVEFDMMNSYILAPGNVATVLLVSIAMNFKKYFCTDNELYGYYYIICKGDKLNDIYIEFPSIDFNLIGDKTNYILSIPTKDLFVCDEINNECVFQIIGNVYYLEQKWILGTVIYNSNIIEIDYDNNKIYFASLKDLNILNSKSLGIIIHLISLVLLIGILLSIYTITFLI